MANLVWNPVNTNFTDATSFFNAANEKSKDNIFQRMRENLVQDERTGLDLAKIGLEKDKLALDRDRLALDVIKAEDEKAKAEAALAAQTAYQQSDIGLRERTLDAKVNLETPLDMYKALLTAKTNIHNAQLSAAATVGAARLAALSRIAAKQGVPIGTDEDGNPIYAPGSGSGSTEAQTKQRAFSLLANAQQAMVNRKDFINKLTGPLLKKFENPSTLSEKEKKLYDAYQQIGGTKAYKKSWLHNQLLYDPSYIMESKDPRAIQMQKFLLGSAFTADALSQGQTSLGAVMGRIENAIQQMTGVSAEKLKEGWTQDLKNSRKMEEDALAKSLQNDAENNVIINYILDKLPMSSLMQHYGDESKTTQALSPYFGRDLAFDHIDDHRYKNLRTTYNNLYHLLEDSGVIQDLFTRDRNAFNRAFLNAAESAKGPIYTDYDPNKFIASILKAAHITARHPAFKKIMKNASKHDIHLTRDWIERAVNAEDAYSTK